MFEVIMTKSFPKLMTDIQPQIQDAQKTLKRINTKKSIPRCIFKLQKIKGKKKILKEARE